MRAPIRALIVIIAAALAIPVLGASATSVPPVQTASLDLPRIETTDLWEPQALGRTYRREIESRIILWKDTVWFNAVVDHNRKADEARRIASVRRPVARTQQTGGAGGTLASIRACESGGDYGAVSPTGRYRGAYQFSFETWGSVGGSGDPAAASPAEQDHRATILLARSGSSPWPVCG